MVNSSYDIYIITFENFSLVLSQELQAFDFNPRISQLFSHGKNWYHLFATNFTGCFTGISWSLKFHIFFHRAKIIHFLPKDIIPEFTAYFTWQKYFTWVSQGLHMHFTGLLPVVSVVNNFPMNEQTFRERMLDMEQMWQFPCCWSAIDGCHISIKCPPGGFESSKECHIFKNFYSIVLIGQLMPSTGLYGQVVSILAIHMTQSSCNQLRYGKILTIDPVTGERRNVEVIRKLLQMTRSPPVRDTFHQATLIRNCLKSCGERKKDLLNSSLSVKNTLGFIQ